MATCQSLYYECKEEWGYRSDGSDGITQRVKVHCRQWSDDYDTSDIVIEKQVIVDGETVVHNLESHNGYAHDDAYYIRKAIAIFDGLLANHPALTTATGDGDGGGNGRGEEEATE